MATPKVLGLVLSCGVCPNHTYYSGGVSHCRLVNEVVRDNKVIEPFCPLPDFPSRAIADMGATIAALRTPQEYGLGIAMLSHIATKLGLHLGGKHMGLTILYQDGDTVCQAYLALENITRVMLIPVEIVFRNGASIFRIFPDSDPGQLQVAQDEDGTLWRSHPLAK